MTAQATIDTLATFVRALGAQRVDVHIMPAGHASIDIVVESTADAALLVSSLGMPALRSATNGRNEWQHSERGDYGFERLSIVAGHRPVCQCHGKGEAA